MTVQKKIVNFEGNLSFHDYVQGFQEYWSEPDRGRFDEYTFTKFTKFDKRSALLFPLFLTRYSVDLDLAFSNLEHRLYKREVTSIILE